MEDTFKSWQDIKRWCTEHKFKNLARRLQLNNDFWMSSGAFGRDQVAICDAIRFAIDEEEALEIASEIDAESANYMKF